MNTKHSKKEERMRRREAKAQRDRLNKAAPALLGALKGLMWRFDDSDEDVNSPKDISPDIIAARTAIAKAKEE